MKSEGSRVRSKTGETQINKEVFVKWEHPSNSDVGIKGPPNLDPTFNFTFKGGTSWSGRVVVYPPTRLLLPFQMKSSQTPVSYRASRGKGEEDFGGAAFGARRQRD